MRPIKFRAWLQFGKEPGYMFIPQMLTYREEDGKYGKAGLSATDPKTRFVSTEVMQFTGLHDKNGVEIYESDIVRWWDARRPDAPEIYKVKFNTARFLLVKSVLNVREMFVCGKYEQCEVIGNVHENPELLSKASEATA